MSVTSTMAQKIRMEIPKEISTLVGIDEVGRGPIAGPVTVCACRVPRNFDFRQFRGIKDSKQLSAEKRDAWHAKLSGLQDAGALNYAFAFVSAREIDENGIVYAIKKAIRESLDALSLDPRTTKIFLDGALKAPEEFAFQETIIKGDEKVPLISAASIVAKVMRDKHMVEESLRYPRYGFESHKGYGTDLHYKMLRELGPSPIHRKTFIKNLRADIRCVQTS